jgi:hypothetical protein
LDKQEKQIKVYALEHGKMTMWDGERRMKNESITKIIGERTYLLTNF